MDVMVLPVASIAVLDECERLGLDRTALAQAVGLELELLTEPDARIPASRADALWAIAVETSGDPCLGIHAAEALPFGAYRVIDFLAANAATLGEGLTRICSYCQIIDPRIRVEIEAHTDRVGLRLSTVVGRPAPRLSVEYTMVALVLRSSVAVGFDWRPLAIELFGPPGTPRQRAELERVLGVAATHEAEADRLWIRTVDWTRTNEGGDRALFEVLDRHAEMLRSELPIPGPKLLDDVRAALGSELRRGGTLLLEDIARRLGVSGRTLQRRLDEHQLRFGDLVDEVRAEQAKALLGDAALGLGEIAFVLGFSDQSAFGRAFKRWTGSAPGHYRRTRKGGRRAPS